MSGINGMTRINHLAVYIILSLIKLFLIALFAEIGPIELMAQK